MSKVVDKIKELRANGVTVYSYSRIDVDCEREYYHTYVERKRGIDNIYTVMGAYFHDTIEKIVNKEVGYEELKSGYLDKLNEVELLDIKFPNELIKNSWVSDMNHAVENLKLVDGKVITELHILFQVEGYWFHGYIDLIIPTDEPPYIEIVDWKTSSKFSGKKLIAAGRQLLMYKHGIESTTNFKVRDVKWNMLKYMMVKWNQTLKSGKLSPKFKMVSRGKWVKEMRKQLQKDLEELGTMMDFEIEIELDRAVENNHINDLPEEVRTKYSFEDAYVSYEATEEREEEMKQFVKSRIEYLESKDTSSKESWKGVELKSDHDTFYCANLCGHRKHCDIYRNYVNNSNYKEKEKSEEKLDSTFYDLF